MNNVASPFNVVTQDVSLANHEMISLTRLAGANPVLSEEIIHDLRKICIHLERIRAMVSQANGILERAAGTHRELPIGNPYLSGS
jgi:hypothetical protein